MRWNLKLLRPNRVAAPLAAVLATLLVSSPAAAQQAEKWVGIEIGGSDVKMVILEVRVKPEGPSFRALPTHDTITTSITANMKDGEFREDVITKTVDAVKEMRDFVKKGDPGIPDDHFYVAASGGVARYKTAKSYETLRIKVSELFPRGNGLESISTSWEVGYPFLALVPAEDAKDALYVDVGGSDTKFGYVLQEKDQRQRPVAYSVGFGTTNLRDKIKIPAEVALADRISTMRTKVKSDLRDRIDKDPETEKDATSARVDAKEYKRDLQSKKKIYLGGGASWCMAILEGDWEGGPPGPVTGPGSPVKLRPGTITRFMQRVIDKNADILQLEPKGLSKEQERELEGVRKRFGPKDKLVAAAAILGALADSLDLGNDEKVQVYFAPNSHLAWIQGYVESRVRKIISQTKALSPQDLERAVEQVRKELGEGNSQLKEVAAKLATLSEQLGKLADKASQAPPPVDLQPLLSELRGIREAINKKQTPNNGPVGRQNPPPVPPGVTPAGGDAFTASQHFNRALESYHDCQLEQALIHFDAATRADSYDPASWYGLAITQQRIGLKESARATAWRLAAAFQRDHEAYPSVCVPFERIQGTDRHAVDEYISQATADMMRGRPGPRSLSSVIPTWMKEQSPAAGADRR